MSRSKWYGSLGLTVVALLALAAGGCPGGIGGGAAAGALDVAASASGGATTAKAVTLTATASGGEEPYTYAWKQLAGPTVALSSTTAAQPTFTAGAGGLCKFLVTVTDAEDEFGEAEVEVPVGDIQFTVPYASSATRIAGNPATVLTNNREDLVSIEARVSVFDPQYTDDQNTQMTVVYELVSVPASGEAEHVALDRAFDTISNQGTGDFDSSSSPNFPTLDAGLRITIRPDPDLSFKILTNVGTTMEDFGAFVSGDYVFRTTVTNPDGVQRSRDLTITLQAESFDPSEGFGGIAAGPDTVAVKQLPAGSPGKVTDKIMTADQSATMTVAVFPSSLTSYRFYLVDNNGVAHMDYVTASAASAAAAAAPTDIELTIAKSGGLPTGTYELYYESFDHLGQLGGGQVFVNDGVTEVRFHVTSDYLKVSSLNAALVGGVSNSPIAPTEYEGWTGDPTGGAYGSASALADVNLDGAPDIITLAAGIVSINTRGYVDGSAEALLHPNNSGNFGPQLPAPNLVVNATAGVGAQLAVGDLNGDGFADIAINDVIAATYGVVRIFFHTGDPNQPYSQADDQMLTIAAPTYARQYRDTDGDITTTPAGGFTAPAVASRFAFGTRIAIAPVVGSDTEADLIVTDPGFTTLRVYDTDGPRPAALTNFYNGGEGRVYVFAGGASGQLRPGRPDILTSKVTETGVTSAVPEPGSTEFVETDAKYTAAYLGGEFDFVGQSLAATDSIAVGSAAAYADGKFGGTYTLNRVGTARVTDTAFVGMTLGGVTRTYEFDRDAVETITPGNVRVDISATNADLPANALPALLAAINADTSRVVDATADAADPNTIVLTSVFTAKDQVVRGGGFVGASVGAFGAFAQNMDGIVYTVAANTASSALTTAIKGTANSNMGLGATLAMGDINGTGSSDVVIGALDSGAALGVNDGLPFDLGDDGAVFIVYDGAITLPAAITGVGANTGDAAVASSIGPTVLGAALGVGDVNGDGLGDVFFAEPGFDRIFMIKGAATPATTPDMTFWGVTFDDATTTPDGGSLTGAGTFLFGDINGDTHADWLFLENDVNFGLAGFER
jgi:hypothetical protein